MALDFTDKKIKQKEVKNIVSKNAVECKLEMTSDEVSNVCISSAKAVLTSYESADNEIKYQGKVLFNIVSSGEELKKHEAGVEFSYKVEVNGVKAGDEILARLKVENVKVSLQNGIPTAYATVVFFGDVIIYNDINYILSVEGANLKVYDSEYSILSQKAQKDFSLEDEFTCDYLINNVYSHYENFKIQEVTSGIGIVVVTGEVEVSMLIEKAEDKALIYEKRVIPFRFEHDIDRAMPDSVVLNNLVFTDTSIKVLVDEAKGVSTVAILNTLKLTTLVYETQNFRYLVDCYKNDKYINIEKESKTLTKELGEIIIKERVKSKESIKLSQNTLLECPLFAKIEKIEVEKRDDGCFLTGATLVSFLTKTENQHLTQTELIPLDIKLNSEGFEVEVLDCSVSALSLIEDNGGILIEFDVFVLLSQKQTLNLSLIKNVTEGEDKKVNTSAISVYVPNCGDTLWEVAKCLGVSEEEVLKTNGNLVFPLTGDERIVIYREIKK